MFPTNTTAESCAPAVDRVADWTWSTNRTGLFGSVGPVNVKVTVVDGASGATGGLLFSYFSSFDLSETHDRAVSVADRSFFAESVVGDNAYAFEGDGGGRPLAPAKRPA